VRPIGTLNKQLSAFLHEFGTDLGLLDRIENKTLGHEYNVKGH